MISNYIGPVKTDHVISLISRIRDRANRLIIRELEARNIHGLAPSHGDILALLFRSRAVPMKEFAERINRDKSTVTALIKKLIALGYVERFPDPEDGRVVLIRLTEKGWRLKPDFDDISKTLLDRVYRGFSEEEKEVMVRSLERMLKNL